MNLSPLEIILYFVLFWSYVPLLIAIIFLVVTQKRNMEEGAGVIFYGFVALAGPIALLWMAYVVLIREPLQRKRKKKKQEEDI